MSDATALAGLSLSVLVAISGAVVYLISVAMRIGSQATRIEESQKTATKQIAELERKLERLEQIPVHDNRIAQLEHTVRATSNRVEQLWDKVFSTAIRAVRAEMRASRPDMLADEEGGE